MRKVCLILTLLALISCTHKDFCLHHPHVVKLKVEFNWQNAPEANPKGMCVFFYPKEGGDPTRVDFQGTVGGYVKLSVGEYHAIAYNNDTEAVLFANTHSFGTHVAYTREGDLFEPVLGSAANSAPRAKDTENQRVVITPEMLWGCHALDINVTDEGIGYTCIPFTEDEKYVEVKNEEHVIVLYPADMMCLYSYEIRNVQNIKHAAQMCASLSGMAGGMTMVEEDLFDESITHPLEANIDKDNSKITGMFYTFGHSLENADPHKMLLYVWMDSGEKYYFGSDSDKFIVTDQIHNAPNPRRVHIIIDGLDLPRPIADDSGFEPTVDDWITEYEDLTMGTGK